MAKKKENTSAKQPKKETAEANDSRKAVKASDKKMKVRITGAVAWLGFSWNVGQEIEIDAQQAQEMIDQNVAEKI